MNKLNRSVFLGAVAGCLALSSTGHAMTTFDWEGTGGDGATVTGGFVDSCSDADICNGNGGELQWSKDGITITTISTDLPTGGYYIQDRTPADGGLGIEPDPNGDNYTVGENPELRVTGAAAWTGFSMNGDHTTPFGQQEVYINGVLAGTFDSNNSPFSFSEALTGDDVIKFVPLGLDPNKEDQLEFTGYIETMTFTAVPIPAAAWLFGSGLIGLAGIARKRKAA